MSTQPDALTGALEALRDEAVALEERLQTIRQAIDTLEALVDEEGALPLPTRPPATPAPVPSPKPAEGYPCRKNCERVFTRPGPRAIHEKSCGKKRPKKARA